MLPVHRRDAAGRADIRTMSARRARISSRQAYATTYGLPVIITRCGNFYGGGDLNWNRIVPGTIRSVLRGQRPVIRSDGSYVRDYFYVEDGAAAYMLLAETAWRATSSSRTRHSTSRTKSRSPCGAGESDFNQMGSTLEPGDPGRGQSTRLSTNIFRRVAARSVELEAAVLLGGRRSRTRPLVQQFLSHRGGDMSVFACRLCGATVWTSCFLGRDASRERASPCRGFSKPEPRFPLELVFCAGCSLLQITETVPPEVLFKDYLYFSSFSDTMLAHARGSAARSRGNGGSTNVALVSRSPATTVICCATTGGGYPRSGYRAGRRTLRGRPSKRGDADLASSSVRPSVAVGGTGTRGDVVHAHNVLAHVADLNGFVDGLRAVLSDDGVAVVEVPYVGT